jgi:eukaryotic translation initiation factor 2C
VRATLGVSYASPAYYADRLCERGRAYLRDFYAPNPPTRDRWDKRKNALEKAARDRRPAAAKWPSVPQRKKTKAQKDAEKAEREADKSDRETALEAVKKEVSAEIDRVWGKPAANPLCAVERDKLLKTMYWM